MDEQNNLDPQDIRAALANSKPPFSVPGKNVPSELIKNSQEITATQEITSQEVISGIQVSGEITGLNSLVEVTGLDEYDSSEPVTVTHQTAVVQEDVSGLNIRSGPGTGNDVVGSTSEGASYNVLDEENGWVKISIGDGNTGWVSSRFVERGEENVVLEPPTTNDEKMLQAVQQMGGTNDYFLDIAERIGLASLEEVAEIRRLNVRLLNAEDMDEDEVDEIESRLEELSNELTDELSTNPVFAEDFAYQVMLDQAVYSGGLEEGPEVYNVSEVLQQADPDLNFLIINEEAGVLNRINEYYQMYLQNEDGNFERALMNEDELIEMLMHEHDLTLEESETLLDQLPYLETEITTYSYTVENEDGEDETRSLVFTGSSYVGAFEDTNVSIVTYEIPPEPVENTVEPSETSESQEENIETEGRDGVGGEGSLPDTNENLSSEFLNTVQKFIHNSGEGVTKEVEWGPFYYNENSLSVAAIAAGNYEIRHTEIVDSSGESTGWRYRSIVLPAYVKDSSGEWLKVNFDVSPVGSLVDPSGEIYRPTFQREQLEDDVIRQGEVERELASGGGFTLGRYGTSELENIDPGTPIVVQFNSPYRDADELNSQLQGAVDSMGRFTGTNPDGNNVRISAFALQNGVYPGLELEQDFSNPTLSEAGKEIDLWNSYKLNGLIGGSATVFILEE